MPKNSKDLIQQKYLQSLTSQNEEMRHESFLTDVKLICEGKEFPAHKLILCAASPFLRDYFQKNTTATSILIDFTNAKVLEIVLKFLYRGLVEITEDFSTLLRDLVEACKKLKIPLIYDYFLELLFHYDSNERILSQWIKVDELENQYLKQSYLESFQKNIGVLQTTYGFKNLSSEQINSLLLVNIVNPLNQEEILNAIVSWIKYDLPERLQLLTSFLKKIDFSLLDLSYLRSLMDNPIMKENLYFHKQCYNRFHQDRTVRVSIRNSLIGTSLESGSRQSESNTGNYFRTVISSENNKMSHRQSNSDDPQSSKRRKKERESLKNNGSVRNDMHIMCYDKYRNGIIEFKHDQRSWIKIKNHNLENSFLKVKLSAVCSAGQCIYFFGGKNIHEQISNNCFKLDLLENKFIEISPMKEKRCNADAVKVYRNIYVIGGLSSSKEDTISFADSFERYNLKTECWDQIVKIPFSHPNPAKAIPIDKCLCFIGINNLIWYELYSHEWVEGEVLPRKFLHCTSLSIAHGQGKVFIFQEYQKKVYCFDLNTKAWNEYPISVDLDWCINIIQLNNPETLEFLIVCSKKSYLYKPPSSWELVSEISSVFPNLFIIEQDL